MNPETQHAAGLEVTIMRGSNDEPELQLIDPVRAAEAVREANERYQAAREACVLANTNQEAVAAKIKEINSKLAEQSRESVATRTAVYRSVICKPSENISDKAMAIELLRVQAIFLSDALAIANGIEMHLATFRLFEAKIRELHAESVFWDAAAKVEAIKRSRILKELNAQEGVVASDVVNVGRTAETEGRARRLWIEAHTLQGELEKLRAQQLPAMGDLSFRYGYVFVDELAPQISWVRRTE